MALLKTSVTPTSPAPSRGLFGDASVCGFRSRAAAAAAAGVRGSSEKAGARWASFRDGGGERRRRGYFGGKLYGAGPPGMRCSAPAGEVGWVGESSGGEGGGVLTGEEGVGGRRREYLAREFRWGVRRMEKVGEEMRAVARIQAEAFHEPVALFDDFFFQFFEAEVLSALIYRLRNSAQDRYACLVAEPTETSNALCASLQELVGVVDVSIQRDKNVMMHLDGAEEYLYVSGIAVLKSYRRRKVASALLKACDAISQLWGCSHLALHAYEDDLAARELYSKAGYKAVSGDSSWLNSWINAWIGKRTRVLMIKQSSSCKYPCCFPENYHPREYGIARLCADVSTRHEVINDPHPHGYTFVQPTNYVLLPT